MKHNINPLIHPKLLNSTFSTNIFDKPAHSANNNNYNNNYNKSKYKYNNNNKKDIRLFVYNICFPLIIIIIICFILKDRRKLNRECYTNNSLHNNDNSLHDNDISLHNNDKINMSESEQIYRNIAYMSEV